jgi:homoserine kinase
LFGGMAVATELHPPSARSSAAAPWHVAVCTPEVEVPRTALKAALPNGVPLMKAVRHAARSHALVAALRAGDADAARAAFEDAIVEPVLGELFTGAHPALRGARRAGAVGAWMHANGPTLCALAPSADAAEAAAEAIVAALDAHATRCTRSVYPVAPLRDEGQGA